LICYVKYVLGQ